MSNRIRILSALTGAVIIIVMNGCSSGSKYVDRTSWNPFAQTAPVFGEQTETVARAQENSYATDVLSYTGGTVSGESPRYLGSYSGPQSNANTPATDPTIAANTPTPQAVPQIVAQTVEPQGIAPQGIAPQGIAPQGITPQGIAPQATGSITPAFGSPVQGTTAAAQVPTTNGAVEFTATAPASQEPMIPLPEIPNLPLLPPTAAASSDSDAPVLSGLSPLDTVSNEVPQAAEFPEFAKNAYEALEKDETRPELETPLDPKTGKAIPERSRESLVAKEQAEKELESNYRRWVEQQKSAAKENSKLPRYLQPLSDDREVFDDPNGPFARKMQEESEKEHTFIRQITAADLNMMSDVSSTDELMEWEKEQDGTTDWSKYSASALYNKWRDFLGMGPNEKEAVAIMKKACEAQMEFEKTKNPKKLKTAAELYEKASEKWPDSVLEEDALFYAAECRYFNHEYTKALTLYKAMVTKYSNSVLKREATERLYWLGCYWLQCNEQDPVFINWSGGERPRFSDFAGAKKAFETIFMNDVSDRGRAPDALFALANGYMRRGVQQGDASFESAARYYQQLYEFYPACDHVDKAYQLAMLALYMSYRGPQYDATPLKKAGEIAVAAQKAGRGDPDVLADQLRLIRKEQARYLLVRGEYYERQEIYASARSYYNRLVNEYPESEFAQQAATRYEAIRHHPAEVDQFALVRPVLPFLPKSKNKYYEEHPTDTLESLASGTERLTNDPGRPNFTALADEKK